MSFRVYSVDMFTLETFTLLMARFSPFMLVAYVTSLLASDILSARQKINLLAQTDELTGVLNMRAFRLLLEKEMTSAVRHRESFSIVMVDIDELNRVNDQYGLASGDRMLQTASRTLKNCLRATDIVARSGNDEFIILMTHCSMNHARLVAERILKATLTMSFDIDANSVTTTASIGIAGFPECTADAAKVLDMANTALARSKRDGRNRISCHEEATELPESVTTSTAVAFCNPPDRRI
jgi:diguanylate cyclase (GGDEF)-like protein